MKEILEQFATAQNWPFEYGREDYLNLFKKPEQIEVSHLFVEPITIEKNRNDSQQVESISYSGMFMLLYSSKFDKASYNDRYNDYIKPIINTQIEDLEQHLICEHEASLDQWKITEVINILDYNLDGVIVDYKVTIDE